MTLKGVIAVLLIATNFGPLTNPYSQSVSRAAVGMPGLVEAADRFVAQASGRVTRIELPLRLMPNGVNEVTVAIYAEDGDRPAEEALWSECFFDALSTVLGLVVFDVTGPELVADTPYWLSITPGTDSVIRWYLNTTGDTGNRAERNSEASGLEWFLLLGDADRGAYRITGEAVEQ